MLTFGSRLRSAFGFPSHSRPRSECEYSHSGRGWDLHSAFVLDLPSLLAYTLALWDLITNGPKTLETLHPLDVWEFVAIDRLKEEQIVVLFHSVHQEVFLFSGFLFTGGFLKNPPRDGSASEPRSFWELWEILGFQESFREAPGSSPGSFERHGGRTQDVSGAPEKLWRHLGKPRGSWGILESSEKLKTGK